ncbi:hypothetical protein [Thiohalorhabdus sp.]|uniref:hypothetical protein n=1 Tax=Thiohalorhabdus sp. TaxID=3094134 RepID=UPI002FC375BA
MGEASAVQESATKAFEGLRIYWIDGEPMVYDLDLARALGYSRPRRIRELIGRLLESGVVSEGTAARRGGSQTTTYYLGEKAALKVVTKSETPRADAITDHVIDVFTQVKKGQLPQQVEPEEPKYPLGVQFAENEEVARLMGLTPEKAAAAAARLTERETGRRVTSLFNGWGDYLTVADMAERLGTTERNLNLALEANGLHVRNDSGPYKFKPTQKAVGYYIYQPKEEPPPTGPNHEIMWHQDVLELFEVASP